MFWRLANSQLLKFEYFSTMWLMLSKYFFTAQFIMCKFTYTFTYFVINLISFIFSDRQSIIRECYKVCRTETWWQKLYCKMRNVPGSACQNMLSHIDYRNEEPCCTEVECYWCKSELSRVGTTLKFITSKSLSNGSCMLPWKSTVLKNNLRSLKIEK